MEKILALYLRSSVEQQAEKRNQNNPEESDTIANQRELLKSHAARLGLAGYRTVEYVDDGHTGTNFDRPAFQQLVDDAKHGKVQALIVKDFSRMGRDYIGVGDYMEQFFPSMGIRVISINDGWDSDEHLGETLELDASFRTLLYDMYSRDLSRKRKSSNKVRNEKGIYSTSLPPYGYQKKEGDIHHLVIDPEEAEVVRRIFSMFLAGAKRGDIAKTLTSEGIQTPSMRNVGGKPAKANVAKEWPVHEIGVILRNEMYTGTVITNRYEQEYGAASVRKKDPSEWHYFPGRHDAIVSKEDFDKAQELLPHKKRPSPTLPKNIYPVYCGHCGRKLSITTRGEDTLMCKTSLGNPDAACGDIQIRRLPLEDLIVELINLEARIFLDWAKAGEQESARTGELSCRIKKLRSEAEGFRQKRMALYESYREGQLTREDFFDRKRRCLQMEEECLAERDAAEAEFREMERKKEKMKTIACDMQDYRMLSSYDPDICHKLIERIEVFHDGHISVKWRFSEDFPELPPAVCGTEDVSPCHNTAAVYSSDMRFMEEENDGEAAEEAAALFCKKNLGLDPAEIDRYYDKRNDSNLFYHRDYMRMMAMARSGKYQYIVIRRFSDLYISNEELHNFLYWTLPSLPCRLISVEDSFDSGEATEAKKEKIYQTYCGVRKGDMMRYRAKLRAQGAAKAKPPVEAICIKLYGYYQDGQGCYADNEAVGTVKLIFRMFLDGASHKQVYRYLNEHSIPTPAQFLQSHGMGGRKEKHHRWDGEKLWAVTRNENFACDCKYRFLCDKAGKHCERHPIISKEDFEAVNRLFQYRSR